MTKTYLLRPHDPLLVRDGRPFTAGGFAQSLPFVMPTTLSGLMRTTAGQGGDFGPEQIRRLLELELRGPLLCDPERRTLFFPAPKDAVVFGNEGRDGSPRRLSPACPTPDILTDLPEDLMPLTLSGEHAGKAFADAPPFWTQEAFYAWLSGKEVGALSGLKLLYDRRIHVAVNPAEGTAEDGQLFGTSGLDFQCSDGSPLALLFCSDAQLPAGMVPFGGERRLSLLTPCDWNLPAAPTDVLGDIARTGRARVFLLTPAMFEQGWKPSWLLKQAPFDITLKAAAVGRPDVVSGWDFEKGRPKPTRRLAPAGSVYFLELGGTEGERYTWAKELWLSTVSDEAQDRRDGLGLAALGLWPESGQGEEK